MIRLVSFVNTLLLTSRHIKKGEVAIKCSELNAKIQRFNFDDDLAHLKYVYLSSHDWERKVSAKLEVPAF